MANVSHAVNGSWALLVMAASIIKIQNKLILLISAFHKDRIFHCPCDITNVIEIRMKQSPIRLVTRVISPLFRDFLF